MREGLLGMSEPHNPYSPPRAVVADESAGAVREGAYAENLYSVNQIAFAGFLGGAMAAAWLASNNYRAMQSAALVTRTRIIGALVTAGVLILAVVLPEDVPSVVFTVAIAAGAYSYAQGRFRKIVEGHVASGGEIHSWWRVVGISLLVVLVTIVIAAGVVFGLAAMGFMPE
jgi:hypothetical protein